MKWSLLIVRDIMFGNRRHFRELLTRSEEGILQHPRRPVEDAARAEHHPRRRSHPQAEGIYSPTEQGIELLPVLAQMSAWGYKYLPS